MAVSFSISETLRGFFCKVVIVSSFSGGADCLWYMIITTRRLLCRPSSLLLLLAGSRSPLPSVFVKVAFGYKFFKYPCIKKALASIDEEDYSKTLNKLAEEKYESLKEEQYLERKKKTIDYLVQKGYEYDLINKTLSCFADK